MYLYLYFLGLLLLSLLLWCWGQAYPCLQSLGGFLHGSVLYAASTKFVSTTKIKVNYVRK